MRSFLSFRAWSRNGAAWEWSQGEAVRHRLEPPQAVRLGRAESSRDIGGRAANEPISKYFLLDATRNPSTPLSFAQDDMDELAKMIGVDFNKDKTRFGSSIALHER